MLYLLKALLGAVKPHLITPVLGKSLLCPLSHLFRGLEPRGQIEFLKKYFRPKKHSLCLCTLER